MLGTIISSAVGLKVLKQSQFGFLSIANIAWEHCQYLVHIVVGWTLSPSTTMWTQYRQPIELICFIYAMPATTD